MLQDKKNNNTLLYKCIFTAIILLVYLVGKAVPLYMIDVPAYMDKQVGAEELLTQTISGDIHQSSLFALGISPYMLSMIIVQVITALRNAESKARISPIKNNRRTLKLMMVVATVMAITRVQDLNFKVEGGMLLFVQTVAALEMITGAVLILFLITQNKKYGIGGQTAIIFVNILDGIIVTLKGHHINELWTPLAFSLVVMFIMIIMENTEIRIPVQRISVHNIYADKNYMAIKLNPIGVMPAMFSMAFFMLPQMIIGVLVMLFPDNGNVLWWESNMTLSKPLGIGVYIFLLFLLTVGFSRVFINPREITEQFLKSGDSILNIHAGRDTKKYISGIINAAGMLSAVVMGICLSIPMILQVNGNLEGAFTTLPSSVMMLTGIWCNLYRETCAIKDLESYKPFI